MTTHCRLARFTMPFVCRGNGKVEWLSRPSIVSSGLPQNRHNHPRIFPAEKNRPPMTRQWRVSYPSVNLFTMYFTLCICFSYLHLSNNFKSSKQVEKSLLHWKLIVPFCILEAKKRFWHIYLYVWSLNYYKLLTCDVSWCRREFWGKRKVKQNFCCVTRNTCIQIVVPGSQVGIPGPSGAVLRLLIKIDEATKLAASSVRSILKIPSGSHA